MWKILISAVVVLAVVALGGLYYVGTGALGKHEGPGSIEGTKRAPAGQRARAVAKAAEAVGQADAKQILFGDLHVHTTFSFDAFMISMPALGGEGSHPPADACDFARYCSAMDFWSINDHAEQLSPRNWQETIDSIRQCNLIAGSPSDPDMVSFLGWEWTQVGITADEHYGHKNVVLAHTEDDKIPARPIGSARGMSVPGALAGGVVGLRGGDPRWHDLAKYWAERRALDICPEGVPVRDLPLDCLEQAATPADLFAKLDEWGHDSIVIPHGTTWGFYTPPGSDWKKQLAGPMHDPTRQTLIEIYSGHGDSEVYREWRGVDLDAQGKASCPEPSPNYLPSCWRAGEIIEERCLAEGESAAECASRAVVARRNAAEAGRQGHLTVSGETGKDWLDAGQCIDCDEPAFNYRPGGAAQYIAALGNFDENPADPKRFRMGFMSSSDNHYARPGTGYKEVHRRGFTESLGPADPTITNPIAGAFFDEDQGPLSKSIPFDINKAQISFTLFETERQASYFLTGGLTAVHATGRDRESIWDAMQRKEVYGTSGPRMLLWFDLLNPGGAIGKTAPMGSEVELSEAPVFQVRAVGSFEQKPGCPDYTTNALSPERIEHVCKNECYHPSDKRRPITRIDIVKIQPQKSADEDIAKLIRDPWQTFTCKPDPAGCVATFQDPDYTFESRDTLYYARAYEAPAPGINAGGVNCERDGDGKCISTDLCGIGGREGDCLEEHEPRAWSSPIWVDFAAR